MFYLSLPLFLLCDFFKNYQRKAALGKVGKKRPEHSKLIKKYIKEGKYTNFTNQTEEERKQISLRMKKWYKENEHPKGMLKKNHYLEIF